MNQNILTPVPEPLDFHNDDLEKVIQNLEKDRSQKNLNQLIHLLQSKMNNQGLLLIPVTDEQDQASPKADLFRLDKVSLSDLSDPISLPEANPRMVELAKGGQALAAFTSHKEFQKGEPSKYTAVLLKEFLEYALSSEDYKGIVLNPWDVSVLIDRKMISQLLALNAAEEIRSGLYIIRSIPKDLHPDAIGCFITESFEPADAFSSEILKDYEDALRELRKNFPGLKAGSSIMLSSRNPEPKKPSLILLAAPISGEGSYEEKTISEIYANALQEAAQSGCENVILPALTEDDFGISLSKSIPATILTMSTWCAQNPQQKLEIFIRIPEEDVFDEYLEYLQGMENETETEERQFD